MSVWRLLNYTNDTKSRNASHFLPLNPLKTSEIKFVLAASLAIKLNQFISEFYSLGCSFNIKNISILPVSWWVRSVTKNEKGEIPLLFFATDLTYQLKQGLHYEIHISVSNLTLIIMKSYKIGNSRGRTRTFARSKMGFFPKIVNGF